MADNTCEQYESVCIMNDDIIKGFQVNEKIDEGNFGQVFKVSKKGKKYAMKIEPNRLDGGPSGIKMEIEIMMELARHEVKYFPKFISGGKEHKFHMLVMDLLGDNLKKLRMKSQDPNTASSGTWSRVGIQCLYVIKQMHDCGYVHRDIKPTNFAMGPSDETLLSRVFHLFDFGISRKFVNKKKSGAVSAMSQPTANCKPVTASAADYEFRRARKHTRGFKGTPVYASPNAHTFVELGRADDLWSLLYMIAELVQPLPWALLEDQALEKSKLKCTLKELFKNDAFEAVEEMLRSNNYYSFPDYELVYKTFRTVFEKSGSSWVDPYDWETKQMPAFQRWAKNAEGRTNVFPWESSEVLSYFRADTWSALQTPTFAASKRNRGKPKKQSDADTMMTAETMTLEEANTPVMVKKLTPYKPPPPPPKNTK